MALRHDDALPPLTTEQQKETILLAARLQAEHEARSSSEALMRAAAEAGIDARFVVQAAHQVAGTKKRRERGKPVPRPLAAALILATLNALAIFWEPFNNVGVELSGGELTILVAVPFLAALIVAQERRVRWTVPASIAPLWLALALPFGVWSRLYMGQSPSWLPPLVVIVGALQILAALVGSLVGGYRTMLVRVDRPQSPLA